MLVYHGAVKSNNLVPDLAGPTIGASHFPNPRSGTISPQRASVANLIFGAIGVRYHLIWLPAHRYTRMATCSIPAE